MFLTPDRYTHRNGRTARVDREGDVFILVGPDEELQPYAVIDDTYYPDYNVTDIESPQADTICFSAGRKEKLSRGDIVGFLTKECGLPADKIGKIDLYDHYALAAIDKDNAADVVKEAKGKKIKGERRLVTLL